MILVGHSSDSVSGDSTKTRLRSNLLKMAIVWAGSSEFFTTVTLQKGYPCTFRLSAVPVRSLVARSSVRVTTRARRETADTAKEERIQQPFTRVVSAREGARRGLDLEGLVNAQDPTAPGSPSPVPPEGGNHSPVSSAR